MKVKRKIIEIDEERCNGCEIGDVYLLVASPAQHNEGIGLSDAESAIFLEVVRFVVANASAQLRDQGIAGFAFRSHRGKERRERLVKF